MWQGCGGDGGQRRARVCVSEVHGYNIRKLYSISAWLFGFTSSFTMAFHRGFVLGGFCIVIYCSLINYMFFDHNF